MKKEKREDQKRRISEELILDEADIVEVENSNVCRLSSKAESQVKKSNFRRLVLSTDRVVDLAKVDLMLVPAADEVTEIICAGGIVATRIHATNIQVDGPLLAPFGLVSTDPEGWLAVHGDMLCERLFAKDVAVGGVLSAEVMAADNVVAKRLYVGRLLGGINSVTICTDRHFDGEVWTRGAYVWNATDIHLKRAHSVDSLEQFKARLTSGIIPGFDGHAESFERYQLRDTNDLTFVDRQKIVTLHAKLREKFSRFTSNGPESKEN
ncbi:MAG TPA: hypothetical protein VF020_18645 [Chthoniobacterales bacterium]